MLDNDVMSCTSGTPHAKHLIGTKQVALDEWCEVVSRKWDTLLMQHEYLQSSSYSNYGHPRARRRKGSVVHKPKKGFGNLTSNISASIHLLVTVLVSSSFTQSGLNLWQSSSNTGGSEVPTALQQSSTVVWLLSPLETIQKCLTSQELKRQSCVGM